MPDYRQANGQANSWRRAREVHIKNPRGGTPMVSFVEEDVVQFGNQEARVPVLPAGGVAHGYFEPGGVIQMRDPQTGELTGTTVTHAELYAIMHSLYIQLALERDASMAPAP